MSDETMRMVVVFGGVFLILMPCAWVHASTMKNIEKFGSDDKRKHLTASQSNASFYIAFAGCLVIVLAALKGVSSEIIVATFVAVLGGLGVKLTHELKNSDKPQSG